MRPEVQRGRIVYLTVGAHLRLIPKDEIIKLAGRPFLVVQNDILNESSDTTVIVRVSSSLDKVRNFREGGSSALLPKGILKWDSIADCTSIHTVFDSEITKDVSKDVFNDDVMRGVEDALRTAMLLDPDSIYKEEKW